MMADKTLGRKAFQLLLPLVLCLATLLTGCVRYEVGIHFKDQHHGEIVQHVQLAQQLTRLSQSEVTKWLESIERRTAQLEGKAEQISPQEILVTIPFNNGNDLTEKFNEFFNPSSQLPSRLPEEDLELVQLNAEMSLSQSNWLLLERNRLTLNVDLRGLGVLSERGNIIVSPGSLIDIELALDTPWGVKTLRGGEVAQEGNRLIWSLKPGQIDTLEVAFWVPSFLGLGGLAIVLAILGGFSLKWGTGSRGNLP